MTDLDAALDAVRDVTDGYRAKIRTLLAVIEHLLRVIARLEGHNDTGTARLRHLGEQ